MLHLDTLPERQGELRARMEQYPAQFIDEAERTHTSVFPGEILRAFKKPRTYNPTGILATMFRLPFWQALAILRLAIRSGEEEVAILLIKYKLIPPRFRPLVADNIFFLDLIVEDADLDPYMVGTVMAYHAKRLADVRAQFILSQATPEIAQAGVDIAKTPMGFADRWKILQTVGIAPVPKSQISNVTINNSRLQQTQVNLSVPRLEDVVRRAHELAEGDSHEDNSSG